MLFSRLVPAEATSRRDSIVLCLVAALHLVALIIMVATEADLLDKAAFLLVWAVLNCFWLALVRRPTAAALLSLELVVVLTLLSRFKFDKLWMTVDFVDLLIIDQDTSAFLLAAFPSLRGWIGLAATATAGLLIAAWRFDRYRVGVRASLVGGSLCLAALVALSLSFPTGLHEDFVGENYVSKFARTGVEAIHEFAAHGFLESDASVTGSLNAALAQWLIGAGHAPPRYVAAQGTVLGRAGRVFVEQVANDIWMRGGSVTVVDGTVQP